jgi:hypothetical protein
MCTCCGLKLADTIQASKHFSNSQEHKEKVEEFKKRIEMKVLEKKE